MGLLRRATSVLRGRGGGHGVGVLCSNNFSCPVFAALLLQRIYFVIRLDSMALYQDDRYACFVPFVFLSFFAHSFIQFLNWLVLWVIDFLDNGGVYYRILYNAGQAMADVIWVLYYSYTVSLPFIYALTSNSSLTPATNLVTCRQCCQYLFRKQSMSHIVGMITF